jgi:hypothetical protein
MRGIRLLFGVMLGIGAVLALITTFIAVGYALKIIAALAAVLGVFALVIFLVWAAIREFVIDPLKKPPK